MNTPSETAEMTVVALPLAQIDRSKRLRPVDPVWSQVIAESIKERKKQFTPILVQAAKDDGTYRLIAGAHRCDALESLWRDTVLGIVLDVSDDEAMLLEIDENLARSDLNDLDRAIFMGERKRVFEKLHPQSRHGKASKKDKVANSATILRFTLETAGLLKQSERTIQMLIHRDKHLTPEVKQRLRGTWIAKVGVELDAIARLKPDEQLKVVEAMLREEDPQPNVHAALVAVRGIQVKPKLDKDVQISRLMQAWKNAGAEARKEFREFLATPASKKAGA